MRVQIQILKRKKAIKNTNWYKDLPKTFQRRAGHYDFRKGNFVRAFKKYSRKIEKIKKKDFDFTEMSGKSLTLRLSGGLGDNIQFIRFAKELKNYNLNVIVQILPKYKPLEELFSSQEYIDEITDREKLSGSSINLRSLPYVLNTTLETLPVERYISIDNKLIEHYRSIISSDHNYKIGIQLTCGKPKSSLKNFGRDVDLSFFKKIALKGITFYNLDRDNISDSLGLPLVQIGEKRTFVQSAAIMENMDLIITIDTAMSHLAGAMHLPTWVLLPHPCHSWRYFLDEKKMPWYPSMTLFRQTKSGHWDDVFDELKTDLQEILMKNPAKD